MQRLATKYWRPICTALTVSEMHTTPTHGRPEVRRVVLAKAGPVRNVPLGQDTFVQIRIIDCSCNAQLILLRENRRRAVVISCP